MDSSEARKTLEAAEASQQCVSVSLRLTGSYALRLGSRCASFPSLLTPKTLHLPQSALAEEDVKRVASRQ